MYDIFGKVSFGWVGCVWVVLGVFGLCWVKLCRFFWVTLW